MSIITLTTASSTSHDRERIPQILKRMKPKKEKLVVALVREDELHQVRDYLMTRDCMIKQRSI